MHARMCCARKGVSSSAVTLVVQDGGRILVDSLLACGVSEPTACKITVGIAAPCNLLAVSGSGPSRFIYG